MKKSVLFLGMGAMLLASCSGNQKKIDEDSIRIADLTAEYQEAATFNDSLMLLMGDIYTGLDSINMQEGLLYNMGNSENGDRRAEIRQNLASIKARLAANKALLTSMEEKIKTSGNENSVMSKTIKQLKERIASQDKKIAQLERPCCGKRSDRDSEHSGCRRSGTGKDRDCCERGGSGAGCRRRE